MSARPQALPPLLVETNPAIGTAQHQYIPPPFGSRAWLRMVLFGLIVTTHLLWMMSYTAASFHDQIVVVACEEIMEQRDGRANLPKQYPRRHRELKKPQSKNSGDNGPLGDVSHQYDEYHANSISTDTFSSFHQDQDIQNYSNKSMDHRDYEAIALPPSDKPTKLQPVVRRNEHENHEQQHTTTLTRQQAPPDFIMDIISIGSHARPDYQAAQQATMASSRVVRHFVLVTESHDTEASCHTNLTVQQMRRVVSICNSRREKGSTLRTFTNQYASQTWLEKKANPTGWMCAQKRPMDGLRHYLRRFRIPNRKMKNNYNNKTKTSSLKFFSTNNIAVDELPDYLALVDDDTWLNLDVLEYTLPQMYPPNENLAIAGCLVRKPIHMHNFTFPFGGWGTILTKPTLHRLLTPLQCSHYNAVEGRLKPPADPKSNNMADFHANACYQLQQNTIGESEVFRPGMSVIDLLLAYVFRYPYLDVFNWQTPGFCFHSDWIWGYFFNYYWASRHSEGDDFFDNVPQDRFRAYEGSELYRKAKGQCVHQGDKLCNVTAAMCHYVTSDRMLQLQAQIQSINDYAASS